MNGDDETEIDTAFDNAPYRRWDERLTAFENKLQARRQDTDRIRRQLEDLMDELSALIARAKQQ